MIDNTVNFFDAIYINDPYLKGNIGKINKIRLKAKPHFQINGEHTTDYETGKHYWFDFDEIHRMIEPNINAFHSNRLEPEERKKLLRLTSRSRERFGYLY